MQETLAQFLGQEDPLENNIALTREKLKAFPLQEQDKMSTLAICI